MLSYFCEGEKKEGRDYAPRAHRADQFARRQGARREALRKGNVGHWKEGWQGWREGEGGIFDTRSTEGNREEGREEECGGSKQEGCGADGNRGGIGDDAPETIARKGIAMSENLRPKDLLDPSNLHYEFPLKDKEARFKELIIYVAHACVTDPTHSKVKLLKTMFHADFESYGTYRVPITGMPYRKLPYGACPANFPRILEEMIRDHQIHIHRERVHDFTSQRLFPLKEPTFEYLTARDTFVVNRWIQLLVAS